MRPYILSETTWKTIRDSDFELAVLPWGATEAHNLHLPFSTDNIETERIAAESARFAYEKGGKVIVLPCMPFGVNTGQLDIKVNISLNPSTQFAILKDIASVLKGHSIPKLLILNGHGGNDFRQMIRELGVLFPDLFTCTCNWYQAVKGSDFFEKQGDHADEMETSLMMFLAPGMILPLEEAGKGEARKFRIKAFGEKWAWAERKWSSITKDTGVGDPSSATREKGEKFFRAVTEKIGNFILELSKADVGDLYE